MIIELNREDWCAIGTWPLEWKKYQDRIGSEKFSDVAVTPWLRVQVPGSIHNDLLRNNLIEDPYFEMNSIKCEWVHNRAWIYKVQFKIPANFKNKKLKLIFKGVDYFSYYFLNDTYLGEHDGMFTKAVFSIDDAAYRDRANTLYVIIEKAPEEVAQMGETRNSRYQKSRFGYKWDFGTRLVNMGIWDDVLLEGTLNTSLDDLFIQSDFKADGSVEVLAKVKICSGTVRNVKLCYTINKQGTGMDEIVKGTALLNCNIGKNEFVIRENIEKPELWWPNGYGEQKLYMFNARLFEDEEISDEKNISFGVREVSLVKNENSSPDSLPYTVVVNGCRVFIKGWNWVPLDHMYGSVEDERYEWFIRLAVNANVNLLRVWGGGLIEKEVFYNLCDRYGILVWQEFIQSSSNRSSETNKNEEFLELLYATSKEAVVRKRNHPCLAMWCGGNELIYDDGYIPQDDKDVNLQTLKQLVEKYDPGRAFLPTSPSGPSVHFHEYRAGKMLHHDIHGVWKYEGAEYHYKKYNMMDCLLHSEFGADGCACPGVIRRIMDEQNILPANKRNILWNHLGAAWWDIDERDEMIFGPRENLEQIVKCSQFIQAESLRYTIESHRRRKFNCSGCIPWQFNEPWPNATCTNSVDYYGNPKMVYYWVGSSYEKLHASLRYEKLYYEPGEEFKGQVYLNSSYDNGRIVNVKYDVVDIYGEVLKQGAFSVLADSGKALCLGDITWGGRSAEKGIFLIRLTTSDGTGMEYENLYVFSQIKEKPFRNLLKIESTDLQAEALREADKIAVYVKNTGKSVALFVNIYSASIYAGAVFDNNFITIFPGETKIFKIRDMKKGFDVLSEKSALKLDYFNSDKEGRIVTV